MPYVLGIDIGASYTKAAIRPLSGTGAARSDSLLLGAASDAVRTVLHVAGDGSVAIGEAAEGCDPRERDRIIRGFPSRVGDAVPYLLGEKVYPAEQLLATMIAWVVDRAAHTVGEDPQHVTLTHPATWGPYKIGLLHAAAEQVGLPNATLRPSLDAAAMDYAAECQLDPGDRLVVADLGATAFRVAVLRRTADRAFEPLGAVQEAEPAPGTDLEEAILNLLRAEAGAEIDAIDLADPIGWESAITLRRECAAAAEALAVQPEVVVPVALPAAHAQVVVTRAQADELTRPAADQAAALINQAIAGAGVHRRQLVAVLLAGGAARSPQVAHTVSTDLRRPVAVSANPRATVARGAAVSAAMAAQPGVIPVGRQLARPGSGLARPGSGLARQGSGTALVRRAQHVNRPDETMVLMPDYLPERIGDLDDAELPPRPPVEVTPLDLGDRADATKPWWRRPRRGPASAVLVLLLALGGPMAVHLAGDSPYPDPNSASRAADSAANPAYRANSGYRANPAYGAEPTAVAGSEAVESLPATAFLPTAVSAPTAVSVPAGESVSDHEENF